MHGDDGTNDTREINATDVTNSILYTILMNDFATVSSTSMTSTIYNESTSTTTYADLSQESGQRLWNLSRTAVTSLSETTAVPFNATRSTTAYTSSTTDSYDEFGPPEGVEYIFVPLGVVVSVIILSAVVWVAISLLSLPCDVFPCLPPIFRSQMQRYAKRITCGYRQSKYTRYLSALTCSNRSFRDGLTRVRRFSQSVGKSSFLFSQRFVSRFSC
ncbi:uncharacterized protein LOC105281773 isoform X2 [Ooceraea biroi]|nr:uncharacterized protein LOC105281773 isoform X2 [Ooceraea biroi]